jgi:ABC-2 type transport system permease protein
MVMKQACPSNILERYLIRELDGYLKARTAGKRKEQALTLDDQLHVQQNKGALALFCLQDYIGESKLNAALRNYQQNWSMTKGNHPTTADLIESVKQVIPDTLHSIIHDLFESVTFSENSIHNAVYREMGKGEYEVLLSIRSEKIKIGENRKETRQPINDWIDVGIYSKDEKGQLQLIYLQKHHFTEKDNLITIQLKHKPEKAEIDPFHKLIDRHPADNTTSISLFVEIPDLGIGY